MEKTQLTKPIAIAMLFVTAIIWGSGFVASQMALDAAVSPELLMFGRFSIAAAVIGLVSLGRLRREMKKEHLRDGVLLGVFLFLAFYVQVIALQYTTPANNAFITGSNVVMVPFLWWAVTKTPPQRRIFFCSLLCFAGMGILSVNPSGGFSIAGGDLLTLLCAFFFACQIAATGRYAPRMDVMVLLFLQLSVAAVLSLGVWLLADRSLAALASPMGLGAVLYQGLFSTCLCYFLQTAAQKQLPSGQAAIILSTEALFGALLSVLLGYEPLRGAMLVGGLLILTSLVLTEVELPLKGGNKDG